MEAKNLKIDKLTKKMAEMEQRKAYHASTGDFTAAVIAGMMITLYQRELNELTEGEAV